MMAAAATTRRGVILFIIISISYLIVGFIWGQEGMVV